MYRSASDVGAVTACAVVVFHDEVPSVEAVLAAVGDDVAVHPQAVLAWGSEEECAAAAVDAGDLGVGFEHGQSMARPRTAVA